MRENVAPIAFLVLFAACTPGEQREFRALPHAARVSIQLDDLGDSLPSITDSSRIAAITAFVNARTTGWELPWYGVQLPRVRIGFFRSMDDRGAMRYFGAGRAFFETSSSTQFASKDASEAEIAEFLRLIGAPPDAEKR